MRLVSWISELRNLFRRPRKRRQPRKLGLRGRIPEGRRFLSESWSLAESKPGFAGELSTIV